MWEQRFCGHGDFRDNELLLKNSIYPHCTARPSSSRVRESQEGLSRTLDTDGEVRQPCFCSASEVKGRGKVELLDLSTDAHQGPCPPQSTSPSVSSLIKGLAQLSARFQPPPSDLSACTPPYWTAGGGIRPTTHHATLTDGAAEWVGSPRKRGRSGGGPLPLPMAYQADSLREGRSQLRPSRSYVYTQGAVHWRRRKE